MKHWLKENWFIILGLVAIGLTVGMIFMRLIMDYNCKGM